MQRRTLLPILALAGTLAATVARADTPFVLVDSGVWEFSLSAPKVFWHTGSGCTPTPDHGPFLNADQPEIVRRRATNGGTIREIFHHNPTRPPNVCNPYELRSDIAASTDWVYWVDPTGLVRQSTAANAGDMPALLSATVEGDDGGYLVELVQNAGEVFALRPRNGATTIWRVSKATGATSVVASLNVAASKLAADDLYLYWIQGGALKRFTLGGRLGAAATIATGGVTSFYSEGSRSQLGGTATRHVFFGRGRQIFRYNNADGQTSGALYTSQTTSASIYSIRSLGGFSIVGPGTIAGIFFLESRSFTPPGDLFPTQVQLLYRIPRGGSSGELLYQRETGLIEIGARDLTSDGTYLYWQDDARVIRLAADASALPQTNMRVTDVEVTQTIQDLNNNVFLVQGKRTFVRVHVRSDDPSRSVPGVRCELTASWSGGSGGPLAPVNAGGTVITVLPSPDRENIDQSFLFELPWSWTERSQVTLTARLNPYKAPPQQSYANNNRSVTVNLLPSPRFPIQFIAFEYEWDGVEYAPRYQEDIVPTLSYMRRTYPLASKTGGIYDSAPGLRPDVMWLFDENLGARVAQMNPTCVLNNLGSLCASAYTNSLMWAMQMAYGHTRHYYGFIPMGPGLFPRGQRMSGTTVASGPTGTMCCGASWDTDGTIADWYAAHEIGHTLSRAHPAPASDDPSTDGVTEGCGHSRSDLAFPYAGALIGPAGGSLMGFDAGDALSPRQALPRDVWADLMSYCDWQWMSDYTYAAIYNRLILEQALYGWGSGGGAGAEGAGAGERGDFLAVAGAIYPQAHTAEAHDLRRLSSVAELSRETRAPSFVLEQLGANGQALDQFGFGDDDDDDDDHDGQVIGFGLAVPFAPGTRSLRIVDLADRTTLWTKSLSTNPPQVTSVELFDTPAPVAGIARIRWTATDADGDDLLFDVLYSHDGGDGFLPVRINVDAHDAEIDTAKLGGGTAVVRIVARDGFHTAERDSAPFQVVAKPPVPSILLPEDGLTVEYGQLVNFLGAADDLKDGAVAESGLSWSVAGRRPVFGSSFSSDTLPVGENVIRLTARNSVGLVASTDVTVIVDDDLSAPGPILSVTPRQLFWRVAEESRVSSLSGDIAIANVGGGGIAWTATASAPWITLGSPNGSAPATLRVTVDPRGAAVGAPLSGEVVITQTGTGGQSVRVPIDVARGHSYDEPSTGGDGGVRFLRGDSNLDARVDVSDAVNTLNALFTGQSRLGCEDAADFNDDGSVNISDPTATLNFLFFRGSPAPAPGSRDCGVDPTADRLADCARGSTGC